MSVENFEPSITKNASTADQLLKKNSLSKEQIENPEVLKEKILEKPDNKYQNHNLPEKEEENLNEIKKEQPFLNKDLHTNKDQISHEEIKLDEKEQKIFEKKEKSLKKMTILKHFFSAAPLSIFNKSDKDTKSFSNNYIVAYQRDRKEKSKKSIQFLEFFTKSTALIESKIQIDMQSLSKRFELQNTKKNIFLSFFKNSFNPVIQKANNDLNNLKNKVYPYVNQNEVTFTPTISFTRRNTNDKLIKKPSFQLENISSEVHKKYPKSPLNKRIINEKSKSPIKEEPLIVSNLAQEEEKLKRLREYKDIKEILRMQLLDLQCEIKNLKSNLGPIKSKDEILKDPLKPLLKKRILISDDDIAKKNAETLVGRLNKERKLKEMRKIKEIENIGKNLKDNIETIKKERKDLEKAPKLEKTNKNLSRIHEKNKNREFLLKGNMNALDLLSQFKNNSELNESLNKEKIIGSPDLLNKKKEELFKIRDLLKNK